MIARLDNDFMSSERAHPIVNPIRHAPRLALDAIQRVKVRDHADLRLITAGNFEERGNRIGTLRAKRAAEIGDGDILAMSHADPAAGDGIFTKFHVSDS